MIYDVRHITTVSYAGPVHLARFNLRLKPADWSGQSLLSHGLFVDPIPWSIQDEFGPYIVNRSRLTLRDPILQLSIESRFRVEVAQPSFLLGSVVAPTVSHVRHLALNRRDLSAASPASYLYASAIAEPSAEIAAWAAPYFADDADVVNAGQALMSAIFREFRYDSGATDSDTPPLQAFRQRSGVCQDFAHVMIIAARANAVPAAYVSGYLRTLPPPGQPKMVGADAMHAWVALWCGDDLGWVGFDPTNNCLTGTDHIFVAMGRDYADVAPVDGVFRGGMGQTMRYAVDVVPVDN